MIWGGGGRLAWGLCLSSTVTGAAAGGAPRFPFVLLFGSGKEGTLNNAALDAMCA